MAATHTSEEQSKIDTLVDSMAEIMRVGLHVCDAMRRTARGRGSHARVTADEQDWMLETTNNPRRTITITLME